MMADSAKAELLDAVEGDSAKAFDLYRDEMKRLEKDWSTAFQAFVGQPSGDGSNIRKRSREVVKREDILRCLFLGARAISDKIADVELARPAVDQAHFIDLAKGPERAPFVKLYLAWLANRTNPKALQRGLKAALYANIPEAVPFARELLAKLEQPPESIALAILVLGNHGELRDVSAIDKLRSDDRVYSEYKTQDLGTLTIQLREVATAMALRLRKQDFTKYGFDDVQMMAWWVGVKPAPFESINWFQDASARDAALIKAGKWLDEQPRPEVKPKK